MFVTKPIEMRMGAHTKILSFIVAPGMERPLVLGLVWLLKRNPYINWRRRMLKIWQKSPEEKWKRDLISLVLNLRVELRREVGAVMQDCPQSDSRILKEYGDLQDIFSEKGSDPLPPHRPTDCSIEILPRAKLPKPKLYSMIPREPRNFRYL